MGEDGSVGRSAGVNAASARTFLTQIVQPMFCDITWGAGGSTADLTLDIATKMQNEVRRPWWCRRFWLNHHHRFAWKR